MKQSGRLLVVENDPKDMKKAAEMAMLAGFLEVEGTTSPTTARVYLEDRLANGTELPDGIVLDLDSAMTVVTNSFGSGIARPKFAPFRSSSDQSSEKNRSKCAICSK